MVTIRRTVAADGPVLREIRLAALLDAPTAFARTHAEEVVLDADHWVTRAVGGPAGAMFLAFDDTPGVAVGLAGGYRPAGPEIVELVSMWTAPSARRHGVGEGLVEAVVGWAGDEVATVAVELWVTAGNDAAVRLYERCGFERTGAVRSLPSHPGHAEVRLRRDLDAGRC